MYGFLPVQDRLLLGPFPGTTRSRDLSVKTLGKGSVTLSNSSSGRGDPESKG